MATVDALIEISKNWDDIDNSLVPEARNQTQLLLRSFDSANVDTIALELLETVTARLPDHSVVFEALEFAPTRASRSGNIEPTVIWAAAPVVDYDDTTETHFLLRALSYRSRISGYRTRLESHRNTIIATAHRIRLAASSGLVTASTHRVSQAPSLILIEEHMLSFDSAAAFSLLPARQQTRSFASAAVAGASLLLPSFQLGTDGNQLHVTAAVSETNRILGATNDPWGAGSWWTTPNGRLGATPADLVNSERESELPFAARALLSDSW